MEDLNGRIFLKISESDTQISGVVFDIGSLNEAYRYPRKNNKVEPKNKVEMKSKLFIIMDKEKFNSSGACMKGIFGKVAKNSNIKNAITSQLKNGYRNFKIDSEEEEYGPLSIKVDDQDFYTFISDVLEKDDYEVTPQLMKFVQSANGEWYTVNIIDSIIYYDKYFPLIDALTNVDVNFDCNFLNKLAELVHKALLDKATDANTTADKILSAVDTDVTKLLLLPFAGYLYRQRKTLDDSEWVDFSKKFLGDPERSLPEEEQRPLVGIIYTKKRFSISGANASKQVLFKKTNNYTKILDPVSKPLNDLSEYALEVIRIDDNNTRSKDVNIFHYNPNNINENGRAIKGLFNKRTELLKDPFFSCVIFGSLISPPKSEMASEVSALKKAKSFASEGIEQISKGRGAQIFGGELSKVFLPSIKLSTTGTSDEIKQLQINSSKAADTKLKQKDQEILKHELEQKNKAKTKHSILFNHPNHWENRKDRKNILLYLKNHNFNTSYEYTLYTNGNFCEISNKEIGIRKNPWGWCRRCGMIVCKEYLTKRDGRYLTKHISDKGSHPIKNHTDDPKQDSKTYLVCDLCLTDDEILSNPKIRKGGKKAVKKKPVKKKPVKKKTVKKIRKHQGIYQRGPKKGRLKPGFKYSGKKTKTGLKIIIKVKRNKKK